MKHIFNINICIFIMLFSGCISTKKYINYINQKCNQKNELINVNDYVEFKDTINKTTDSIVKAEKIKSYFIPAIFYWEWNNTIKCELSGKQTFNTFYYYFQCYADSLNLKDKLNGEKINISFESIPNTFIYTNKGYIVIIIIAYFMGQLEAIFPENSKLIFTYRILNGTKETKSGKIEINNINTPVKNIWKSTKKFTWMYIDQYVNNLKILSKTACKTLMDDIDN